jgi:hypothetical protein
MAKIWQEDVTALFEATGIQVLKPLLVSFNRASYEFDKKVKANWLYYAFLAFLKLALAIKHFDLVASVGAGSGLDGIGMYETFRPKRLKLIDINPEVIPIADSNLRDYFTKVRAQLKWEAILGNLCEPLEPESADLVYGNIPTIPGDPSGILDGMNSSSFYNPAWVKDSPKILEDNFLAHQYGFLRQARVALRPTKPAVIALGVRMTALAVERLFQEAGFDGYEPVILDLKEQSQPKAVIPSYAKQEAAGDVEFDFYREGAQDSILNSEFSLEALKGSLEEWRVSAQEALTLVDAGQKVYHVIGILAGYK